VKSSTDTSCVDTTSDWIPNTIYYYRVRARNSVGSATTWSPLASILTDNYPTATTTLTAGTIEPFSMKFSWTAVPTSDNGRDLITFYVIESYNYATSTWGQLNSDYNNVYFEFEYTPASGYFPASTAYKFRVRPKNGVGYSTGSSNEVSVLSDGVPNGMYTPTAGTVNP
jgi:hypothetical protein